MDVRKVAHLARIHLSEEETETFQKQFDQILGYVEQLDGIDVSGIEPTAHAGAVFDVYRDDEAREEHRLSRDEALSNAPDSAHEQFRMPKVVD